ncbi:hypothetical protein [Sulfurimonas microaerophilic]|uniref:hypothetical protein n=1 Tax=Sulfurimonas microaerophilic TaxID=3058392 RepID=UPI00271498F4|nr:hypothetical protein [Sulfurimonas sp. hsl 1-7]
MKAIITILFTTLLLFAENTQKCNIQGNVVEKQQISKDTKFDEVKQRGCCSWHGGISGCSNGRVVCNDGTYSPSCTCVIPFSPLG